MEYKEIIEILKDNIEIRELIHMKLYSIATDKLNKQFDKLYNRIDLSKYKLSDTINILLRDD